MSTEPSFKFEIAEEDTSFWYDYFNGFLPKRMVEGENASAWFHFLYSSMAQTMEQYIRDSLFVQNIKYMDNPDVGILGTLGNQVGLFQYINESADEYKIRIVDQWATGQTKGTEDRLLSELTNAGYVSSSILFDLAGSDQVIPAVGGGSDYDIQPYPPSSQHVSQFSVVIPINDNIDENPGTLSSFVSDERLAEIRTIVSKYKSVQWVGREIILVSGSVAYWDQAGLEWDDGTLWGSTETSNERHRASLQR
jgi:hypothetical protein